MCGFALHWGLRGWVYFLCIGDLREWVYVLCIGECGGGCMCFALGTGVGVWIFECFAVFLI